MDLLEIKENLSNSCCNPWLADFGASVIREYSNFFKLRRFYIIKKGKELESMHACMCVSAVNPCARLTDILVKILLTCHKISVWLAQ